MPAITSVIDDQKNKQHLVRLILYSGGIVLMAFVSLVFWVVFTIIEHVNTKHQLVLIDNRNVHHITAREEKERTLRALLSESKKVIAYINDAKAFFSEFIIGELKLITEPITLVCPSDVCRQLINEYQKRINSKDLPDDILFVAKIPKFTQTVSAIFFLTGDTLPKKAILLSLHGVAESISDKGDTKWFVFSNNNGIAEHIYVSYDRIEKTPSFCIMREFDSPKPENPKSFIRSHCKHPPERNKEGDECTNSRVCHFERRGTIPHCQIQEREYLNIDWIIESARLLQEDFTKRWKLIRERQYLDFSERSETTQMMESFAESLQSLHAFDETDHTFAGTDMTAWVNRGRLGLFLQKIRKRIHTLELESTPEVDHPHFFGRIFIMNSMKSLFEPYKDEKRLTGEILLNVLKSHTDPKPNCGVVQVGVIYAEDIKDERSDSWIVDFAIYDRTVTWCENLKGHGASNSIGGFSTNRELVENNLNIFRQVWESTFPSLFRTIDGADDFELSIPNCYSDEKSSPKSRTPAEEACWIMDKWNDAKEKIRTIKHDDVKT